VEPPRCAAIFIRQNELKNNKTRPDPLDLGAGIDNRPELIGAAAADRLASMVERRKPTLTLAPQSTLLTGHYVD
jgi:hypothetical protein